MKKFSAAWITVILLLFFQMGTMAQQLTTSVIEPELLLVSRNKTTNVIFPYAIRSVDRGSQDILVQKAIGVENVLQVKAARQNVTETNLTVVTADGSLFSFLLRYMESPLKLNVKVDGPQLASNHVAVFSGEATTDVVAATAFKVQHRHGSLKGLKAKGNDMAIELTGIYIRDGVFYFQFKTDNYSNIGYDAGQFRFFIRDRKKSKRTSSQETELQPVYALGQPDHIPGTSALHSTVAIPKITLPDKKYLAVQLLEKNGARNLVLKISNKVLMDATTVK